MPGQTEGGKEGRTESLFYDRQAPFYYYFVIRWKCRTIKDNLTMTNLIYLFRENAN